MKINGQRLLANLHSLREFTDTPGEGVTRFSYGLQDAKARRYILNIASRLGCSVAVDGLGNIRIGLASNKPGRKTVIAGSHIDTVRNGGWLDGIYGVCGALEVMETLTESLLQTAAATASPAKENPFADSSADAFASVPFAPGFGPSFNYEVAIFAEEEGSNFGSTMTGSKFITGKYGDDDLDRLTNDSGQSLRQMLVEASLGDSWVQVDADTNLYGAANFDDAASLDGVASLRTPDGKLSDTDEQLGISASDIVWNFDLVKTMLELHIEQGPILDRLGLSLGIVEFIFGMRVIEVTLTGVGNHAGATPMSERYDALSTAAECILAAETLVKADEDKRTVVTVGKMDVLPNCSNVIPETVKFSLEVRDKDESKIDRYVDKTKDLITSIAAGRKVDCQIREHSKSSPFKLTQRVIDSMEHLAKEQKLSYKLMDSGAVHDACMICEYADTGMIFIPSINGRSHVPEENTADVHLIAGAQFLLDTVINEIK